MKSNLLIVLVLILACVSTGNQQANGQSERQIQIRSVDFAGGIIEVHNFSSQAMDLSGWRFCSHDFDQERQYTPPNGLNGVSINAGGSIFVHLNNDAPAAQQNALNRSDIGGNFALPLDQDAYAMQFFFPDAGGAVMFGNSSLIADHLQWNMQGSDVGDALERTGQAVSEGLWGELNDFILTTKATTRIDLIDITGDEFGESAEYNSFTIAGDVNRDGKLDLLDVAPFVDLISSGQFQGEADINNDNLVNLLDVNPFIDLLTSG